MQNIISLPKTVSYKELMIVYGLTKRQALHKMMVIRAALGKSRAQNVLVAEFCKAENVEQAIYTNELTQAYSNFKKSH